MNRAQMIVSIVRKQIERGEIVRGSGTLDLALVNGFVPVLGNTFQIATYRTSSGAFQAVNGADLGGVATAIALSRATLRTMRRNLFWAFLYNAIVIPVAAGALYPAFGVLLSPILASAAMALSSISVIASSLWLARAKLA